MSSEIRQAQSQQMQPKTGQGEVKLVQPCVEALANVADYRQQLALRPFLESLLLEGRVVTLDAAHTSQATEQFDYWRSV